MTTDGSHYITPSSGCYPLSRPELAVPAEPDAHIYGHNEFYPSASVELNSSSVLWGIPVAYLTVYSAHWNPVTEQLEILSNLVIEVEYESDPSVNLVSRRTEASELRAQEIVRNVVANPWDDSARIEVLEEFLDNWGDRSELWRSRAWQYRLSSVLESADSSNWKNYPGEWLEACPEDPQAFLRISPALSLSMCRVIRLPFWKTEYLRDH